VKNYKEILNILSILPAPLNDFSYLTGVKNEIYNLCKLCDFRGLHKNNE